MGKLAVYKYFAFMFLVVQLLVSAFTFFGLFGGAADPGKNTALAMLVYILPIMVLLNAILALYWIIRRRWHWLAIPAITLICCIPYVGTLYQPSLFRSYDESQSGLKIASYNVALFGREMTGFKAEDILSEMKKVLPEDEWNEFKAHFTDKTGGCLTFDSDGTEEMLCYVPISDTKWVLVMLVRESMIDEQIRGISECNLSTDRQQIAATLISVLLLATVLLLLMKKNSTEKLEAEKKNSRAFRNMSNTDALTGVKNKYAYSEYEAALDRRIQEKELVDVGVAVCDINNLKQVNDAQGHLAGDQLIKEACAMICSSFAHSPVFRIGGDEFVVLLEKADFYAKDDILNNLNQQIEDNLKKGGVVIAIGVSVLMPGDKYLHVVFERADLMMYERKKELKRRK